MFRDAFCEMALGGFLPGAALPGATLHVRVDLCESYERLGLQSLVKLLDIDDHIVFTNLVERVSRWIWILSRLVRTKAKRIGRT